MEKSKYMPDYWQAKLFGLYSYSKNLVMRNIGILILVIIINLLASIGSSFGGDGGSIFVITSISGIVSVITSIMIIEVYVASFNDGSIKFTQAMSKGVQKFLKMFLYGWLSTLILAVSLLLLIVPFFFVMPRIIFGGYLVVEKNLWPIEALKQSWAMSKGHVSKIYRIIAAGFVMALLVLTIIGIPFSVYFMFMFQAAMFVLYKMIDIGSLKSAEPQLSAVAAQN